MHESVQDVRGHGGVSQVLAPVLHYAVGGNDDGAAQLAALMHDGLQQLGTHLGNAPGQEEIVENQQIWRNPALELLGLFCRASQPVPIERGTVYRCIARKTRSRLVGRPGSTFLADTPLPHDPQTLIKMQRPADSP